MILHLRNQALKIVTIGIKPSFEDQISKIVLYLRNQVLENYSLSKRLEVKVVRVDQVL